MIVDLTKGLEVAVMPTGVMGQISFRRLIDDLKRTGEIAQSETVTHVDIDVKRGLIRYRVEG